MSFNTLIVRLKLKTIYSLNKKIEIRNILKEENLT